MNPNEPLNDRVDAARAFVSSDWSAERAERVRASMLRRGRTRRRARRLAAAASLVLVVAGAGWLLSSRAPLERAHIEPVTTATRVEPTPQGATLVAGSAWFEVRSDPKRPWVVSAGSVEVVVVGTRFMVERAEHQVNVVVDHGAVRVRWPGGEALLTDGTSGTFPPPSSSKSADAGAPPPEAEPELAPDPDPEPRPTPTPVRPTNKRAPHASWQELAQGGQFDDAWAKLKQPATEPRDAPEELMLAADVARLSHHSEEAVAPLQRVLSHHARDLRAPLAAFTLGRVLLDELGRPREAAEAFAAAHRLAPTGPLAEDALARAVESWSRAGEAGLAREAASTYLQRFPHGRREAAVRRHARLE